MRMPPHRSSRPFVDQRYSRASLLGVSACVGLLGLGETQAAAPGRDNQRGEVQEEVIVTAQKEAERLQDVPVPVSTISAESLLSTHQVRMQDYYAKIPGVGLSLLGPEAAPTLAIRGLTMGGSTNPTVGLVVDDVSYGSTVTIGNALTMADIDPSDLQQVEVLRGPQGTLYGASSLGGLLKFTTIDPSTDRFTGRMQAGMTSVSGSDDLGYSVHGAMNVPLSDSLAIRASGFTEQDAGYIDNVLTGERDVNERERNGGRLAAMWRPTDDVSVKLSALKQNNSRSGSDDVHAGLGDLQQRAVRGTGIYERDSEAYGLTVRAGLGNLALTSATGYSVDETYRTRDDTTTAFAGHATRIYGVTSASNVLDRKVEKFSQEVRLVVPLTESIRWLVGGFYTREKVGVKVDFQGLNPATGALAGSLIAIDTPENRFEEYAAFTNLTVQFTERFDVQFGGRYSENDQTFYSVRTGSLVPTFFGVPSPSVLPETEGSDNAFTYLVTPRFKMSDDLMIYARLASGYRPGAPNANCGLVPCTVGADTTENYEIGVKGSVFKQLLSFDASVYYIDWKDIQLDVTTPTGLGYIANAGRAASQGIELSVDSKPLDGLAISAWVALNDAELTEDFPAGPASGRDGDRLPYGSRVSGNVSIDQEFPIGASLIGTIGTSVTYVGDREGVFRASNQPRQEYPSYTQIEVRAGVIYDAWTLNAFVNNATNRRALLGGGLGNFIPTAFNYTQPRTIGLSVTRTF